MSDRLNLGELRQRGLPLFTREAAAIVHEVCSRLTEAEEEGRALAAPSVDQLWVTPDGDLVMDVEPRAHRDLAQSTMDGLAALIEALLPPTMRDQPDFAVPGTFRVLAPRARGFPPGLPAIRTPAELEAAVARYRSGDTTLVLQHLFARTAPAAPATAETPSVAEPQPEITPTVAASGVAATAVAATGVAPPDVVATDVASTADASSENAIAASPTLARRGEFDLPLQRRDDGAWVRPVVGSNARTWPRVPWMWLLIGGAAMVLAFLLSYEVTRRVAGRSAAVAHADEPARSAPARSAPARPEATHATDATDVAITTAASPARPPVSPRAPAHSRVPEQRKPAVRNLSVTPTMPISAPAPLQTPASTGPVFSPSFAASGSALVFHAGRDPVARLMSAEIGESSPLELVTIVGDRGRNYHPRLSPDGRLLAFDSDRDGERGVYVANRDGSHVQRVSGAGFASVPSWSPDMHALAFVRAEPDRPQVWNLWRLERSTGALTRLTQHSYGQTWGASWFPDSRRLCYSHEDRLILLDVADGTSRVFRSPRAGRLVRTPAVSPDGRLLAFQVLRDGVWLLDLDSGVMRRLIEDPSAEEFAWDPNGGRLAYHSRSSGEWRIWIAAVPPPTDGADTSR